MKQNSFTDKIRQRLNDRGAALITVIAIFAAISVLSVSITSLVLASTRENTRQSSYDQAYLTAKSVLSATAGHIRSIANDRDAVARFAGQTAAGELPGMGSYTATIAWSGQNTVKISVTGIYKGESAEVYVSVDGIGGTV